MKPAPVAKARRAEGSADVERIHKEGEEEEEAKVQKTHARTQKTGCSPVLAAEVQDRPETIETEEKILRLQVAKIQRLKLSNLFNIEKETSLIRRLVFFKYKVLNNYNNIYT